MKLSCAWQGHEWAVEDLAGDDVDGGRVFSSDCDGQIKEWNPAQPDQCRNTYTTIVSSSVIDCQS